MASTYNLFLKELADDLTSDDVEALKFLLRDVLPAGKAENITKGFHLLSAMDVADLISRTDLSVLKTLFDHVPRRDLIPKLDKYQENPANGLALEIELAQEKGDMGPIESVDDYNDGLCESVSYCLDLDPEPKMHKIPATSMSQSPTVPAFKTPAPLGNNSIGPISTQLMTPDYFRKKRADSKSPTSDGVKNSELTNPSDISRQDSSHQVRLEEYSMARSPHGECIIFSNEFNEDVRLDSRTVLKKRCGTEKDVESLTKTFEHLNFTVKPYRNKSAVDMKNILKDHVAAQYQENSDCFVVCLLSHGYEGGIYANDGKKISRKELRNIFADNKNHLIGKPKLFFIQACQGDDDGKGIPLVEADTPSITQDHLEESSLQRSSAAVYEEIISIDADFLFFMATTPGTISWRHPVDGSWFVQTLCEVFRKYADSSRLVDLVTQVNNKIAWQCGIVDDQLAKQMSNYDSTLRKQLYFFPEAGNKRRNTGGKVPQVL